jgi:DNA-binding transcriptional MerR regulator
MGGVNGENLVSIGAFSVLTGLSIPTLRHYDDVGLLHPLAVDDRSGYRRYGLDQVPIARLIRALRAVEVPIEAIRDILDARNDDDAARRILRSHRNDLVARSREVADMIAALNDYIEEGLRMPEPVSCRIVEVNIGVENLDDARRFYEAVFGVPLTEERHGDGPSHLFAAFGSWPSSEFFLLNLSDAERDPYRAGRANFGFLVDDLDAAHKRGLVAGGTEISAPHDEPGMPRTSAIVDPSNNLIHLYQNA